MKPKPIRIKKIKERKKREKIIRTKPLHSKKPLNIPIKKEEFKKGIYIIPSLFTCGNMSFGILSVFSSINGNFIQAAWFLVCALACDILDGRIARMTNTTSMFGMQLDSLSDLVSFGIAPAVMLYLLAMQPMGNIGIAIAILYVLCSALRLARFNTLSQTGEIHKHFAGLPTPASAGLIISFVLSYKLLNPEELSFHFNSIPLLMNAMQSFYKIMPIVMVVLSFLMVSNIPYPSFKKMKLSKVKTIELMAVVIVLIILIIVYPQNIIFIIFTVYAVSGLLSAVIRIFIRKKDKSETPAYNETAETHSSLNIGEEDDEL